LKPARPLEEDNSHTDDDGDEDDGVDLNDADVIIM